MLSLRFMQSTCAFARLSRLQAEKRLAKAIFCFHSELPLVLQNFPLHNTGNLSPHARTIHDKTQHCLRLFPITYHSTKPRVAAAVSHLQSFGAPFQGDLLGLNLNG